MIDIASVVHVPWLLLFERKKHVKMKSSMPLYYIYLHLDDGSSMILYLTAKQLAEKEGFPLAKNTRAQWSAVKQKINK